jgi:PAS domain S-box-containing protein
MAEILGVDLSKLVGKPSFDYVFPEDAAAAQRLFDARQNGEAAPFRFRLRREDGSAIWVNVQGTPLRSSDDVFIGIVGTFSVAKMQK